MTRSKKLTIAILSAGGLLSALHSASQEIVPYPDVYLLSISPSAGSLRELSHIAALKSQNYFHPGCGVGREKASYAYRRLSAVYDNSPDLIFEMASDQVGETRNAAALLLGWHRDKSATKALSRLLNDPLPYVRASAAAGLQRIGTDSALAELRKAFNNTGLEARVIAASAFAYKGDREAARVLQPFKTYAILEQIEAGSGFDLKDANRACMLARDVDRAKTPPYWATE